MARIKWTYPSKQPFEGTKTLAGGGSLIRGLFGGRTGLATGSPFGPQRGGGGGSPYAGILADYLNQARSDFGAESVSDKQSMLGALRRAIISYGASPDFEPFGGLSGAAAGYFKEALDPRTQELARKAEQEGISAHARLSKANDVAMRRIPATLAGRGILRSGQTGSDLRDQELTHKQQGYDMLSELLTGITGSIGSFQEAERQRARELAALEMQLAMQAAGDWGDSYMGAGGGTGGGGTTFRGGGAISRGGVAPGYRGPRPGTGVPTSSRARINWLRNRAASGRM